jgi:hypothetical protein
VKTNFLSKSNSFNDFNQVVHFCIVQIVIIIYNMLNIYRVKQKSWGYKFLLCIIMQNQVQEFFCNFLANILFNRQLMALCIFIYIKEI